MYPYQTINQSYRNNGDRHLQNAINYHSVGMIGYCIGSLKKAIKNYEKSQELEEYLAPEIYNPLLNLLANQVADTIMNGKQ